MPQLLEIDEALELVLAHAAPLAALPCDINSAIGCILAETITSDIDSPPHDKSIVDGYAVIAADLASASTELIILEEITAGTIPTRVVTTGSASRIMTGAPIPQGSDAVVMVEKTELLNADRVRILQSAVKAGQNIMLRATSLARGQTVLEPGARLRAIEVGLLAEVGRTQVLIHTTPHVAVLATGNELVDRGAVPGPSQIRNSNGPLLAGLARAAGADPLDLGIGRDHAEELRTLCQRGLEAEILVISGGVSAGVLDLVPAVLESLGVEQVFHKVNLKPGKPLWFGIVGQASSLPVHRKTLVFGLPGNPVSSLVCFELFVRPAIARLLGRSEGGLERIVARLDRDFHHRGDRVTMFPAALRADAHGITATPLDWRGSGDLRTLTEAQGLIHFPLGERQFAVGHEVNVLRF